MKTVLVGQTIDMTQGAKTISISGREEAEKTDDGERTSMYRTNVVICFFSLGVLVMAAILQTDGRDVFLSLFGYNVEAPSVCAFRNILGIDCAGCGLTRSFIALANGELMRSISFHRLGILVFLVVAFQIPYRIYLMIAEPEGWSVPKFPTTELAMLVLIVIMCNWIVNILTGSV